MVITGTSAIVGEDHNLVCTYTPPTGTFPAVEYTWCERGACFSPVPSNRYQISPVSLTDAHSTYRCEVILAGIGTNLGVATASLTITSKEQGLIQQFLVCVCVCVRVIVRAGMCVL